MALYIVMLLPDGAGVLLAAPACSLQADISEHHHPFGLAGCIRYRRREVLRFRFACSGAMRSFGGQQAAQLPMRVVLRRTRCAPPELGGERKCPIDDRPDHVRMLTRF